MSQDKAQGPPEGYGDTVYWQIREARIRTAEKRAAFDDASPAQKTILAFEIIGIWESLFVQTDLIEHELQGLSEAAQAETSDLAKEIYLDTVNEIIERHGDSKAAEFAEADARYLSFPIFMLDLRMMELFDLGRPFELDVTREARGRARLPVITARNRTLAVAAAEILKLGGVARADAYDEAAQVLVERSDPNEHWMGDELEGWRNTELMKKEHFRKFRNFREDCAFRGISRLAGLTEITETGARNVVEELFYSRIIP